MSEKKNKLNNINKPKIIKQKSIKNSHHQYESFYDMMQNAEFFARVISKEGEQSSLEIDHVSITKNGITDTVIKENITIKTNNISGDIVSESSVILTTDSKKNKSKIVLGGNASVSKKDTKLQIQIKDNPKKIKIKSKKGLFCSIYVAKSNVDKINVLNLIFGKEKVIEYINEDKRKNRSHICIRPDGNGSYIRLSDENSNVSKDWVLENELIYDHSNESIFPKIITIYSHMYDEKLTLSFSINILEKVVILESAKFQ